MKKRLLALGLAMLMVLPLAACGKKGPETDTAYIQNRGYITVGITNYAPMDYQDEKDEWIGFDADLARAFAEKLGVDVVFRIIRWDDKHKYLQNKDIDVIWNGMTITDEVILQMAVSVPYCHSAQVVVLSADRAADYQTEDSLHTLNFVAEEGSSGAEALTNVGLVYTPVDSQTTALAETANRTADACVIDLLMADANIGPGTDYPDLVVAMELGSEKFGVGFRKDSDLVDLFNQFWADACADGTVDEVAQRYDMTSAVLKY